MNTKRFDNFFKGWVQFRVGAIPRLPIYLAADTPIYTSIVSKRFITLTYMCIFYSHRYRTTLDIHYLDIY